MSKFSVLLLEDVPEEAKVILDALRSEDVVVTPYTRWDEAQHALENQRYDLVIADLYIFEGVNEASSGKAGNFFCLKPLLDITEKGEPPVPVVVYTGREDLSGLRPYHRRICDFWDKKHVDAVLLSFRLRKIRDLMEQERPSSQLLGAIRAAMAKSSKSGRTVQWHDDMNTVLQRYEEYHTHVDPVESVKPPLGRIASSLKISESFEVGFEALSKIDIPSSTLLPKVRPHLHHSLNVFFLGYYLINLSGIDWLKITKEGWATYKQIVDQRQHDVSIADAEKVVMETMNGAWFLCSLFHDVGISVQYYEAMVNEMRSIAASLDVSALPGTSGSVNVSDAVSAAVASHLDISGVRSEVLHHYEGLSKTLDHGFVSSLFIGKHCYDEAFKVLKQPQLLAFITEAVAAVGVHNDIESPSCPAYEVSRDPMSWLLIFCDAIQSWERQRLDFSILKGEQIEKVELCDICVIDRRGLGPSISMTVRYYPHSLVAHNRTSLQACEAKLQPALQKHVTRPLERILPLDCPDSMRPEFHVKFELGRELIAELNLPPINGAGS